MSRNIALIFAITMGASLFGAATVSKDELNRQLAKLIWSAEMEGLSSQDVLMKLEPLIAAGADVNTEISVSNSPVLFPLQWAAQRGDDALVEKLLAAGAQVNRSGALVRSTAFDYVKNAQEVERLIATALYYAAENGHIRVVRQLLAAGAYVDRVCAVNSMMKNPYSGEMTTILDYWARNWTVLDYVCENRWNEKEQLCCVRLLILHGATVNEPLHQYLVNLVKNSMTLSLKAFIAMSPADRQIFKQLRPEDCGAYAEYWGLEDAPKQPAPESIQ